MCVCAVLQNINFVTDFERHDDDELGFRKNDIITIISQKDEHCWVGELNGLRGNICTKEILQYYLSTIKIKMYSKIKINL